MIASTLAFVLALSPGARAYEFLGYAWAPEDMPLRWYMCDEPLTNLEEVLDYGYPSVLEYQVSMTQDSFDNWYEAECAEISDEYMGLLSDCGGFTNDGANVFYANDPTGTLGAGVLAAALPRVSAEFLREQDGTYLYRYVDVDITWNDNVDWAPTEAFPDACEDGEFSIEAVTTHEIGHMWGMGHSCEEDDTCSDEELRYASMYWSTSSCDDAAIDLGSYDIGAITALYGPWVSFHARGERLGAVPWEVCFGLETSENTDLTSVWWFFGDGAPGTQEESPCHTFTEEGQYTVSVLVEGDSEQCGEWSYHYRQRALVTACEAPAPGLDPNTGEPYPGLFTFEHVEGLQYQMINRARTEVYGCLDTVVWQLWSDGELIDEISAWSPIIELPSKGAYTVLLNVGGPGGMAAAELELDTRDSGGCGCVSSRSSGVATGLLALLGGLGMALGRRRRRGSRNGSAELLRYAWACRSAGPSGASACDASSSRDHHGPVPWGSSHSSSWPRA